jgi:hypothetical protein
MKKVCLLLIAALLGGIAGYAQFSQAVKDSVLKLLKYPGAKYSVSLVFKPEDYLPASDKPDLQKLSRQQLIDKKKGTYTDASIYRALFNKSWFDENNKQEAVGLLTEAGQKYQDWINAEPGNEVPVDELLDMCIGSQNYQLVPGVLEYALPLFPKHLPLLQKAIFFEQYVAKRYDKSEQLIKQALTIDSLDLITLAYQSGLQALYHLQAMQNKQPFAFAEIPGLKAAAKSPQTGTAGLQHLYYHHQLFYTYLKGVSNAMAVESESIKIFELFTLTPEEKLLVDEAENWVKAAAALKGKNEAQLLNCLAVISCMKRDYQRAISCYDAAYKLTRGNSELEGKIMCLMFMDAYPLVEKTLEEKAAVSGNMQDYSSLLRVYKDYTNNSTSELTVLKKLQAMDSKDPLRYQLLASGYLQTGQLQLLPDVLPLLGEKVKEDIMIKLVAAIVNDKRSSAALYLNMLLHLQSDDEFGLAIKKLTAL